MKKKYKRPDLPDHPNFAEFADMILDRGLFFDMHVFPFFYKCDYCNIEYDFIGKTESSGEDTEHILDTLKINKGLWPGTIHFSSGGNTDELAKKYFSMMRREDIEKLYNMYIIDFEMFDYSPDEFIKLGMP